MIDTAIKDHLNQLIIPFGTKLNENITKTKSLGLAAGGDRKKLETLTQNVDKLGSVFNICSEIQKKLKTMDEKFSNIDVQNEAKMKQLEVRLQGFNPRVNALQTKILDLENMITRPDGKMQQFWDRIDQIKDTFEMQFVESQTSIEEKIINFR